MSADISTDNTGGTIALKILTLDINHQVSPPTVLVTSILLYRYMEGGGVLHQIFHRGDQHVIKKKWIHVYGFVKMRGEKDLKPMKMGVSWIKKQEGNCCQLLKYITR